MQQLTRRLWLFCLVGSCSLAMAQGLDIAGTVTDQATGDPMPGVVVSAKGTPITTVTVGDGSYKLKLANLSSATLSFSFVGYKPVEMEVGSSNASLDVAMESAPLEVSEEMVITGFSTSVKRRNLANSIASISEESIDRVGAQTIDSSMSAKFAGVTVSSNTGAPGGGISVNLRGISTINGTSTPLYVIDGVLVSNIQIQSGVNAVTAAASAGSRRQQDQPSNRIADLIPSDIQNIEILKGPSAAAIYGSKASNGVIVITTKSGVSGKTEYSFKQSFGTRSIIKKLGTRRFTAETALSAFGQQGLDLFNQGNFIDYEDELYGEDGAIFETNFSARGGTEKTRFFFSGSALNDEGIVDRTGYDKYGLRLNLDHQFNDRISISVNTSFVRSAARRGLTGNDNTGATWGVSLASTPSFLNLRPVDGVYPVNPFAGSNALHTRDVMKNEEVVNRTISSMKFDWNILQTERQALDFNVTAGVDFFSMENDARFPPELQFEQATEQPGTSVLGETESRNENLYFNATHTLFAGNSIFTTSAGLQFENQDVDYFNVIGSNLIGGHPNLDNAVSVTPFQTRTIQKDRGFFLQEEINIGEAIFLTAGVRGDSSSTNGDEGKFFIYPKFSASLRLSEYDFWDGMENSVPEFKVRAAWGQTGNLPLPFAKFDALDAVFISGMGGVIPNILRGNPNIEPETSTELELGVDGTVSSGKGTFEVTYFQQDIEELLLFRSLEPSSGQGSEVVNGGEMEVSGIEIQLGFNPIKTDKFDWTFRFNYYSYEAEVTKLIIPAYNTGGFADFLGRYRIEEGISPTTIIGADLDANGNHIPLGDETPDFQMGWDNQLNYKNWGLSWLMDIKEGGDVINLTKLLSDLGNTTADLDDPNSGSRLASLGSTTVPWIEDGSYVRLREIKVEYGFGRSALDRIFRGRLSSLRLALSGRNLKTWTDYSSYDPEVSNFGTVAIGRSVEVTPFPSSKSIYFDTSVSF